MNVKVKLLRENAKLPERMHPDDAGADIYVCTMPEIDIEHNCWIYPTGFAIEVPEGWFADIVGRSSGYKKEIMVRRGIVDSGYRGEVCVVIYPVNPDILNVVYETPPYEIGERMAQLIISPCSLATFEQANELSEINNRNGGFGSTNK